MAATREQAYRKWKALLNMTEARGCSKHEAETARRLAGALSTQWGFNREPQPTHRPDFPGRYARAERTAARNWRWEYRKCGKDSCWCATATQGHGPYKYGKRREGKTVRSIYMGS
jgi:hypothetical protein